MKSKPDRSPWGHTYARFPVELCEEIIDSIAAEEHDRIALKALATCAQVCRAWYPRAQFYLKTPDMYCKNATLSHRPSLSDFYKPKKQFLLKGREPPITHFFTVAPYMPWLRALRIDELDLEKEHTTLVQTASSLIFVEYLKLQHCKTQNAAQLSRFVTSFPALSTLNIGCILPPSGLRGSSLRCNRSKSSLRHLQIWLKPHISPLFDCFITARPFVTNLRVLELVWTPVSDSRHYNSLLQDVGELFAQCGNSLEQLHWKMLAATPHSFPQSSISLSPLTNLQSLKVECYTKPGNTVEYALHLLETVSVGNKLTQISILQPDDFGEEVKSLDHLLTSERFRAMRNLHVLMKGQIDQFPKLRAQGVQIICP
ncbi:hypothetical protein QCA50_010127 [Cerrena zonata]|uniref:F-box domain-containing protein n=1 Tax=Cerrena zonata TaxID=2478898 RepID=A0AAW0FYD3_9APHY